MKPPEKDGKKHEQPIPPPAQRTELLQTQANGLSLQFGRLVWQARGPLLRLWERNQRV